MIKIKTGLTGFCLIAVTMLSCNSGSSPEVLAKLERAQLDEQRIEAGDVSDIVIKNESSRTFQVMDNGFQVIGQVNGHDSLALAGEVDDTFYLLDKDTLVLRARRIPFSASINFRDMGGIRTTDGRAVKWGKIYRSGSIGEMNDADLELFKALQIAHIYDFRSDYEVGEEPDMYPSNVAYHHTPIGSFSEEDMKRFEDMIKDDEINPEVVDSLMIVSNRSFVQKVGDYRELFDQLLAGDSSAVLFHCSAGKDRTGFGAAIILHSLGVERDVIFNDYLLSNNYNLSNIDTMLGKLKMFGLNEQAGLSLLGVKRSYLEAAFDEIDSHYGSVDEFLEAELGIGKEEREVLREKYLY